jgi:uncharacterized protein
MVPSTVKILGIFAGVLAANRAGLPLGPALAGGGILLHLWAGHGLADTLGSLSSALISPDLVLLLAVTVLLLEFGRFIGHERNAEAILGAAGTWGGRHGRAMSLMIIPAAIGLVPMPGGALVSAPLVDRAAPEAAWSPAWKSAVNYWFRHLWEYWWPLFPVVIVTLSIFRVPPWQYMAALLPFSVASALAGYVFLVRPHLEQLAAGGTGGREGTAPLRPLALALGCVVLGTLALPPVLGAWLPGVASQHVKMIAMLLAMSAGLWVLYRDATRAGVSWTPFGEMGRSRAVQQLSALAGVVVFQLMLESSALLPEAGAELVASGIPLLGIVALLPFIAGLVTGIAVGFAGAAFPIVTGLLQTEGSGLTPLSTLVLAFGFGYAGMMLSPVHLCLILTREYFAAPSAFFYRLFAPCVAALLAVAVALCALLRALGW